MIRIYIPYAPMHTGVVAHTAVPAAPLLNERRRAAVEEAPHMPVVRAQTLEHREAEARRHLVRTSAAVAAGGALALLLAGVSLYAAGTFAVRERWREIGVRTALGARRGQIVWMFFRSGTLLGAAGLVVGLPLSVLAVRGVAVYLRLLVATSPLIGAVIGMVVLGVTAAAAWIPARRAGSGDPNLALRAE